MRTSIGRRFLLTVLAIALVLIALQLGIMAASSKIALVALAVVGLLLGFVSLALLDALVGADAARRKLARRTMVFSLTPPVLIVAPQATGLSTAHSTAFLIGTIVWVALALIFSAFAVDRLERQDTVVRS
jgi:hypothetical protein